MNQIRRFPKTELVAFCIALAFLAAAPAAFAEGALDGKTFEVTVRQEGSDEDGSPDTLRFDNGNFFSTDCEQYGFVASPYEATVGEGSVKFKSKAKSDTEGTSLWKGKVKGDTIAGSFVWSKPDQEPIKYVFEGKLKS